MSIAGVACAVVLHESLSSAKSFEGWERNLDEGEWRVSSADKQSLPYVLIPLLNDHLTSIQSSLSVRPEIFCNLRSHCGPPQLPHE